MLVILRGTSSGYDLAYGDMDGFKNYIYLYNLEENGKIVQDSMKIRGNGKEDFSEEKTNFFNFMDELGLPYNDEIKNQVTSLDERVIKITYNTTVDIYSWRFDRRAAWWVPVYVDKASALAFSMDFKREISSSNTTEQGHTNYYSVDDAKDAAGLNPNADEDLTREETEKADRIDGYEAGLEPEESAGLEGPNWDYTTGVAGAGAPIENPITFPGSYKPTEEIGDTTEVTNIAVTLIRGVRTIGIIFAVIALMIYGIRYMFGSLEEKAEYKETMMPWIIGSLLLVVGTTIVQYIYTIASTLNA